MLAIMRSMTDYDTASRFCKAAVTVLRKKNTVLARSFFPMPVDPDQNSPESYVFQ
jgi:hypothetical protein